MLEIIWQSIIWILPAYIANGSAVLLGGGTPIDFNKNGGENQFLERAKHGAVSLAAA